VANLYIAPLENDFKIDVNGVRASMGHFLCGVETVKSNLKKISEMSSFPPWKISENAQD